MKWHRTYLPGCYISDDNKFTAELRPAGYYPEFGCKLTRHYLIRNGGSNTIRNGRLCVIGTARTLKQAAEKYL